MKRILMEWSSDPQFAVWHVRIHQFRGEDKDPEDILFERFVGWWYGDFDFGETPEDTFPFEFTNIKLPGGGLLDYLNIWSTDLDYGYLRDSPGPDYWRAEGEALYLIFNNQNWAEKGEKLRRTYALEITPLYIKKKE